MGDKSTIEWTDATWNPVTGCTKVSQGCKNCYAERVFPRAYGSKRKFTDVRTHPERLDQPLRWAKPRRIFVNSMSDLFHEDISWEFLDAVFAVMALSPQHTFQVLTKRPRRMRDYFGRRPNSPSNGLHHRIARRFSELARNDDVQGFELPLSNVWLGVSVEDQATAQERIPLLLQTPARVRFLSCEPLLGPINLHFAPALLHWVIAGGESGPRARPSHPDWFRSLRDQCAAAGLAFFFKQWGEWALSYGSTDGVRRAVCRYHGTSTELVQGARLSSMDAAMGQFAVMRRLGKKAAGRELDGRTHEEYPT